LLGMAYELEARINAARESYQQAAQLAGPDAGLYQVMSSRADWIVRNPPTPVPTATPIPTPEPTPRPTSAIYQVQQGDTLKTIADQFGVQMGDIIEWNELEDPDELYIGQMLLIPPQPE